VPGSASPDGRHTGLIPSGRNWRETLADALGQAVVGPGIHERLLAKLAELEGVEKGM